MKVVVASTGLGYTRRGIESWISDLAPRLGSAGHTVELWSGGPIGNSSVRSRRLFALNRDVRWIRGLSWDRRYVLEQLSVLPLAIAMLRLIRADMFYCGDPLLSWHLKKFHHHHGARVVFMNGMRLSPGWARHFDGVHLLAQPYLETARAEVGARDAGRFFAVPHFADVERFTAATPCQRVYARRALGLEESAFVVVNVGPVGLASRKRLDYLAEEVAAAGPKSVLVSVGADEDGAKLVHARARDVLGNRYLPQGTVRREKMPAVFHAGDVYSLGSIAEPFSIAILEAMASGLPIVHHSDGVMKWQTGAGGIAVSMTQKGDAAAAFRELEANPGFREEVGARARNEAETRYSPQTICDQLWVELLRIQSRPSDD